MGLEALRCKEFTQWTHLIGAWVHIRPRLQAAARQLLEDKVCAREKIAQTGGREHGFSWWPKD